MGSMSASDAAPLPRLGEVFFDVRGESRSMRLSWYADTGVAVFSIWQGGTCTGTFRLPIADLPRMVEASLAAGVVGRARAQGRLDIRVRDRGRSARARVVWTSSKFTPGAVELGFEILDQEGFWEINFPADRWSERTRPNSTKG